MTLNFTTQVSITATCNTCNKQARCKETVVNGGSTSAIVKFRNDLKMRGWGSSLMGDKCPECNVKGDIEK